MQLKIPKWVRASLVVLGIFAATPALADELPSSSTKASSVWRVMHPATFAGTHKSAFDQCRRDAALSAFDLLTPQKCELAKQKLASGDYDVVMVPDGVVHDFLNGRNSISQDIAKGTGRLDRALLLDLGDGVFMYWYTGDRGKSCNNVGITIVLPSAPPPPVIPEEPAPPPSTVSYRLKRLDQVVTPGTSLSVGGNVVEVFVCPKDCVCDGSTIISTPRITTGGFPTTSGSFEN